MRKPHNDGLRTKLRGFSIESLAADIAFERKSRTGPPYIVRVDADVLEELLAEVAEARNAIDQPRKDRA